MNAVRSFHVSRARKMCKPLMMATITRNQWTFCDSNSPLSGSSHTIQLSPHFQRIVNVVSTPKAAMARMEFKLFSRSAPS